MVPGELTEKESSEETGDAGRFGEGELNDFCGVWGDLGGDGTPPGYLA